MSCSKKTAFIGKECVACGTCLKVCARKAITIHKGCFARVDAELCVGCGKCSRICPAGVIELVRTEAETA